MMYTIDLIATDAGWRYFVTLWCGTASYRGTRPYLRQGDAGRAARATKATPKDIK